MYAVGYSQHPPLSDGRKTTRLSNRSDFIIFREKHHDERTDRTKIFWDTYQETLMENGEPFALKCFSDSNGAFRHYAQVNAQRFPANRCICIEFTPQRGRVRYGVYLENDVETFNLLSFLGLLLNTSAIINPIIISPNIIIKYILSLPLIIISQSN